MTDPTEQLRAGLAHHQSGRLADAETIYRQVLAQQPDQATALNLLAVLCAQTGRNEAAIELLRGAVRVEPSNASAHSNLGEILRVTGRMDEAVVSLRRAVELNPAHSAAHNNLANALSKLDQPDEAIAHFRRAVELNPGYAEAWSNLAAVLLDRARHDDAIQASRRAIELNPRLAGAYNNLGNALSPRDPDAAAEAYRKAVDIDPNLAEAWSNLGALNRTIGRLEESIRMQQKAIALLPTHVPAYSLLGVALQSAGLLDDAIASYRKGIELDPTYREAHQNLINAMNYRAGVSPKQVFEEHLAFARRFADPLKLRWPSHENDRSPDRRLRIGYLSGDFRTHSVAFFLEGILEHHDRAQFEVYLYSNTDLTDAVTDRLRGHAYAYRDITALTDDEAAQLIQSDGIDILIDLAAHTAHNRLAVASRRPAPVQATYLGYPNTTGVSAIDWRLTDAIADPPGKTDEFHVEKLYRLPRCAWSYRPPDAAPPVAEVPRDRPITFGSFNALAKIGSECVKLWASVLREVPESQLLIKALALQDPFVQKRLTAELVAAGVEASRFELRGTIESFVDHLRTYERLDIALDSFPYHGTTTTCEALWMGVPVITLAGNVHASRVGASLLNAVGLDDLVATTPGQFAPVARTLAVDRDRVSELRRTMRDRLRASSLLDAIKMTQAIEVAYRQMWKQWCAR